MFWKPGYYWQEETFERRWCMECTQCAVLNFDDTGAECSAVDACAAGDQLWVRDCDGSDGGRGGDTFSVTAAAGGAASTFHQIRIAAGSAVAAATNLCLERVAKKYVTVQTCNATSAAQLWTPISATAPFVIVPAEESADAYPFCMTQTHHPKDYETVGLKNITRAKTTRYWVTYETRQYS